MQEIYEQLTLPICRTQRCGASAFRARLSVLLGTDEVLKIHEGLYKEGKTVRVVDERYRK